MKSSVVISVEFYYQGKRFTPAATIDLDSLMRAHGGLPDLSLILARANDIGDYTYELEIMRMEPLHFDSAEGLVAAYIHDGELDKAAFVAAWHEQQDNLVVQSIARRIMQIDDLDQHPDLRRALQEAYRLGKVAAMD
jgi:hypothetical protein